MKMMTKMLVFQVCRKAWMLIHHVSEGRMSTIRRLVEDNTVAEEEFKRREQKPKWN